MAEPILLSDTSSDAPTVISISSDAPSVADLTVSSGPKARFQAVLKEICHGNHGDSNWLANVHQAFVLSDSLAHSLCSNPNDKEQLEALANQLWNKSVVLKSKDAIEMIVFAKLRYISFTVVGFVYDSTSEVKNLKKLIIMGVKTAKAWMECKEYQPVENVISTLKLTAEKLHTIISQESRLRDPSHSEEREKHGLDKDIFVIFGLDMDLRVAQGKHSEGLVIAEKAGEMLNEFPNERYALSMRCHNSGVDCFQAQQWSFAVSWLKLSYAMLKGQTRPDVETQSRTLRLMSNCYIEWQCEDWATLALNTITLANEQSPHFAGLFIHVKLLLITRASHDNSLYALKRLLQHQDCDIDASLSTISMLKKYDCYSLAYESRQLLLTPGPPATETVVIHSPVDKLGLAWLMVMDLLMADHCHDHATAFATEVISAHNTIHKFDESTKKQFHVLYWKKAAQCLEKSSDHKAALTWYRFSLGFFPSLTGSDNNLAKLHRNMATCYIHTDNLDKAKKSAELSEVCSPHNPSSQFLLYKIALRTGHTQAALDSLQKLTLLTQKSRGGLSEEENGSSFICLAAHQAVEVNQEDVAVPALEAVISHCSSQPTVLTALRCLCRLVLQRLERGGGGGSKCDIPAALVPHLRTSYNKLLVLKDLGGGKPPFTADDIHREASWFMKLSWNLALSSSKEEAATSKELFTLCCQLLTLCHVDVENHHRSQTCLLMASAACLQLARGSKDGGEKQVLLEEVLQHVEEYRLADRRASNSTWAAAAPAGGPGGGQQGEEGVLKKKADTHSLMLYMFEFEALNALRDPRAESVLERATTLPNPNAKLFHNLAALAMDGPSKNSRLCMRALKIAIRFHLKEEKPDFHKCSTDLRQLIEMALSSGDENEAVTYFRETLDVIETRAGEGEYPETEVLWLMIKAWNHGLNYFNCDKLKEAELWAGMSMKLLKHVSCPETYQDQMMSVYGELMARMDREH